MIAVIPQKNTPPGNGTGWAAVFIRVAQRNQEAALAFNDYNLQVKKHAYRGLCAPAESGDSWGRQNDANLAIRN
jgi:hypothetical protein